MKKLLGICILLALVPMAQAKDPEVVIRTSMGDVTVRLFPEKAPATVENFLQYADSGYYKSFG